VPGVYAGGDVAKKRRQGKQAPVTSDDTPLRNSSAFAGLAGLRDALPAGEAVTDADADADADEQPDPAETADAEQPTSKVVLQREKKGRGGKTVTRVTGLANDAADAKRWAKKLKRQLGCGAVVDGADVVLLGDVGDRAAEVLATAGLKRVIRGN